MGRSKDPDARYREIHDGPATAKALEADGYVVAREVNGLLVSVERDGLLVWLDVGNTVRVIGDRLGDPEDVLSLKVVKFVNWGYRVEKS